LSNFSIDPQIELPEVTSKLKRLGVDDFEKACFEKDRMKCFLTLGAVFSRHNKKFVSFWPSPFEVVRVSGRSKSIWLIYRNS